ncbi:MAG: hypothetical protein EOO99_02580 [Pedobacter sp.]|nr:MAG: hypothetical protein EOO99_02580 [Pedobacter sp.]
MFISIFSHAQLNRNSLYVELGGNSGIYSLNYDRLLDVNNRLKFAPRIGFSTIGRRWFSIPFEANILWSKQENAKNFAEFGLGTTFIQTKSRNFNFGGGIIDLDPETGDSKSKSRLLLVGRLGFRHQKPQGGFMFRIGLNILSNTQNDFKIKPFPSISLGHSF